MTSRRLVRSAALGILAGYVLLASSTDVFAASMAHQAGAPIVKGACATRPKAAIVEDAAFTPTAAPGSPSGSPSDSGSTSASATPTPSAASTTPATPTKSVTPIPTPTSSKSPTAAPTDKPTDKPTSRPTSTPTLTPTTSPSPTTSPTKSPTTSPSPTPSKSAPAAPQLCVSVQPLVTSSRVQAGHNATFVIWVWSTKATAKGVTVALHVAQARHVLAPHFTVCPSSTTASCAIGTLPTGQADELRGAAFVQKAARAGEQVELAATASGTSAKSYNAQGSVVVTTAPSPTPTTSSSAPPPTSGVTLPPVAAVPPVSSSGAGAGLGNPANLFPTVSPSPSTSSPAAGGGLGFPRPRKQSVRVATSSAIVPLDPRLIGGQLAGLAVLAGAIAIAIARLSLRKPRPQGGPGGPKADA